MDFVLVECCLDVLIGALGRYDLIYIPLTSIGFGICFEGDVGAEVTGLFVCDIFGNLQVLKVRRWKLECKRWIALSKLERKGGARDDLVE